MTQQTIIGIMKDKDQIKTQLGARDKSYFVFGKSTLFSRNLNIEQNSTIIQVDSKWQRVVNPNNTYKEYFRTTLFKDSALTTANWDTTNHRISIR